MKVVDDGNRAYHFEPDPDAAAQDLPGVADEETEPYWNN